MTKIELEMLASADKLDLTDAIHTTAENILNYFKDIFEVDVNKFDTETMLGFIENAVLFAYKTGADTTEAIMKDGINDDNGEIIDAEFTIVEVSNV